MALSKSITSLITDDEGHIAREFLGTTQKQWADEHMQRRYGAAAPLAEDPPDHPAMLCYQHLLGEYTIIKRWFDDSSKLSPLLMSRHLAKTLSGPVGNGIGWDFKPNGDPEPLMLQFKGTLISCRRAWEVKAPRGLKHLDGGSLELGGLARLVRAAFTARAELHTWHPISEGRDDEKRAITGADVARRWIAWRTYNFLIQCGAEESWAWGTSKAREVFGPVDLPAQMFS